MISDHYKDGYKLGFKFIGEADIKKNQDNYIKYLIEDINTTFKNNLFDTLSNMSLFELNENIEHLINHAIKNNGKRISLISVKPIDSIFYSVCNSFDSLVFEDDYTEKVFENLLVDFGFMKEMDKEAYTYLKNINFHSYELLIPEEVIYSIKKQKDQIAKENAEKELKRMLEEINSDKSLTNKQKQNLIRYNIELWKTTQLVKQYPKSIISTDDSETPSINGMVRKTILN